MVAKNRAIILGAGVSGLVVGFELLRQGWQVEIFEKEPIPGGLARTFRFDDYFVDLGPHLFHTSSQGVASYWESLIGDAFSAPSLYGQNLVDGRLFDYPLTREDLTRLPPDARERISQEMQSLPNERKMAEAASYKDYMVGLAGDTLQRMFYDAYPEKLWGIPPSKLSPNWAPARIEIRDERRPFHSDHWTAISRKGCGYLAEVLAEKIAALGGKISYETPAIEIGVDGTEVTHVRFSDGSTHELGRDEVLISTIPITSLARAMGIETSLQFRKIRLVSIVFRGEDPMPDSADWLYVQDREIVFHRIGSQTRFSREGLGQDLQILTAEIAYDDGDPVCLLSDQSLIDRVVRDLRKLPVIGGLGEIVDIHCFDAGPVYPKYFVGYEEELRKLQTSFTAIDNLFSTGSPAEFAYSDLQIVTAKAVDFARYLNSDAQTDSRRLLKGSIRRVKGFSSQIMIGKVPIGTDYPPVVIAEIGLNHNGSVELAKQLISEAASSGCQLVKLQTFGKGRMSHKADVANYSEDLLELEESLPRLFDRLVLPAHEVEELFSFARERGVTLFSTPFDPESVDFLGSLEVPAFKISSMDIENFPLIRRVAATGKPVLVSTGMASLSEIESVVEIFERDGNRNLLLMHCVSSYPSMASESNLRALVTMRESFGTLVGFSDHHPGISLVGPAVALGARAIEKHFTLDKRMKGPDHFFSLNSDEMRAATSAARESYLALGDGRKIPQASEAAARRSLRRSIFARVDLHEGKILAEEDLAVRSPGTGISPAQLELVVGRTLAKPVAADMPITWGALL